MADPASGRAGETGRDGRPAVREPWPLTERDGEHGTLVAACLARSLDGAVLSGPAGVGKSRLVHDVVSALADKGVATHRLIATETLRSVPFGALAPLLPVAVARDTNAPSAAALVASAVRDVVTADPSINVLLVDDLHSLDESSASVIAQLLTGRWAFLLATVRAGESVPSSLRSALQSAGIAWLDLQPFDRRQTRTVAEAALGHQLDAAAASSLWQITHGNALYLRELVESAQRSGALVLRHGTYVLRGALPISSVLAETVAHRLDALPAGDRAVADLLALCEPVPRDRLVDAGMGDAVDALVAGGHAVIGVEERPLVRIAHPVHAEVLRNVMKARTRRQVLQAHVDRLAAARDLALDEELQLAVWRLDLGVAAGADALLRAAQIARNGLDMHLACRLARAAFDAGAGPAAALVLGDALYELGEHHESARIHLDMLERITDPMMSTFLALSLHRVQLWGLDAPDDSIAMLRAVRDRVSIPFLADALRACEMSVLTFSDRPLEAMALDTEIADTTFLIDVLAATARCTALGSVGRTHEALDGNDRIGRLHPPHDTRREVMHPVLHLLTRASPLYDDGRFDESIEAAEHVEQVMTGLGLPVNEAWAAIAIARSHVACGRYRTALRHVNDARAAAERAHLPIVARSAIAYGARCTVVVGTTGEIAAALDEVRTVASSGGFFAHELSIAEAACLRALGRDAEALTVLRAALDRATERGMTVAEIAVVHELARAGRADEVAARARALTERTDGRFSLARLHHALALADGTAEALADAADELDAIGSHHLAAEAFAAASAAARHAHLGRHAQRCAVRAAEALARCEGVRAAPPPDVTAPPVRLTAREREIATLAAHDGMTSKAIADRLHLSVRTVENHLQHAFTKLGVTSRVELAAALQRSA